MMNSLLVITKQVKQLISESLQVTYKATWDFLLKATENLLAWCPLQDELCVIQQGEISTDSWKKVFL